MTDKEAFELLVKYSDEKGLVQQREMIRILGIEKTADLIISEYKEPINQEFKKWLLQALNYLNQTSELN